ncbi:hypothetical protein MNBD_IGNAVI01-1598 [hydrothermal vent metagenome]|uniref:Uncharacterized protein n=1 Tax=hydrothermal vent metagenome TaxID=652676 RepID=A0A3B1CBS3_9ZZZZ
MLIDIIIITFLFSLFGISHSILASSKIKQLLVEKLGDKIAFYRLFFNLSSILILLFVYRVSPKPSETVYDLEFPFDIVIFILQIFSIIGFFWAASKINVMEFIGISQIKRYMENNYDKNELDEKMEFKIEGPFKYTRHPIYLFSTLFLALRPTMDIFYFIFFLNILLYFYIGSFFEERKLVEVFGHKYIDYQKAVPRFFPIKFKRRI